MFFGFGCFCFCFVDMDEGIEKEIGDEVWNLLIKIVDCDDGGIYWDGFFVLVKGFLLFILNMIFVGIYVVRRLL